GDTRPPQHISPIAGEDRDHEPHQSDRAAYGCYLNGGVLQRLQQGGSPFDRGDVFETEGGKLCTPKHESAQPKYQNGNPQAHYDRRIARSMKRSSREISYRQYHHIQDAKSNDDRRGG